jgi:4-hydroxy-tetrahydrodipicolinate synthase
MQITNDTPMAGADRGVRALKTMFGLSAALATPFNADLSVDLPRMIAHAVDLLAEGCSSVTLFGTTGEGASLTWRERAAVLHGFTVANFDPTRLVVGISSTAAESAADQALAAFDAGVATLLVPPPFYFKGVSDDGVFAWYAALLERVGRRKPQVILYHIPQVTGVGLSLPLVRKLKNRYGDLILGVKDSGGDWPTTRSFLGEPDLSILVGDERHLAAAIRLGGAGAISGMANVFPGRLAALVRTGQDDSWLNAIVDTVVKLPATPAVKVLVGLKRGESGWERVRAPLQPTPAADIERVSRLARELTGKTACAQ